jgi:hypothetical protein
MHTAVILGLDWLVVSVVLMLVDRETLLRPWTWKAVGAGAHRPERLRRETDALSTPERPGDAFGSHSRNKDRSILKGTPCI